MLKLYKINKILIVVLAALLVFTCVYCGQPSQAEAANSDFVIFLAPGHTPVKNFSRTTSAGMEISEGELNERLTVEIGKALRNAGYSVYLTNKLKWTSTDLPVIITENPTDSSGQFSYGAQLLPAIENTGKYSTNVNCDLVISVHHNANYVDGHDDVNATGIRFYYNSDYSYNSAYPEMNYGRDSESARVSKIAAEAMTAQAKNDVKYTNVRSVTDIKGTDVNNSICRNTTMASVLVEAGFMTAPTDLEQIVKAENQQVLAGSIVKAVNSCKDQLKINRVANVPLTLPDVKAGDEVIVDGVAYTAGTDGAINLPNKTAQLATTYVYNTSSLSDLHNRYPEGMHVYSLQYVNGKYTYTRLAGMENIMNYVGTSIRITGQQGIRVITGIPTASKDALVVGSLHGYTLLEDGLVVAWDNDLDGTSLTFSSKNAKSATAYVRGVKNPVYSKANGETSYTNVLTFTSMEKCKPDLAMRSYMKVMDSSGKVITLYGGVIHKSIEYIAQQNKNTYKAGTSEYNYIWNIINYCNPQTPIMGSAQATKEQMMNFFIKNAKNKGNIGDKNTGCDLTVDSQGFPNFYKTDTDTEVNDLSSFVDVIISEANKEGVRPEVVFAQLVDETGYLRYTGDVRINQYNFAGIGATGNGVPGNSFESMRIGIRAQVQHLKAYASSSPIVSECVDPRYNLVSPKGKAPYVEQLSGAWAANLYYGSDLVSIIKEIIASSKSPVASASVSASLMSEVPENINGEADNEEAILQTEEEIQQTTDDLVSSVEKVIPE